MPKLIDNHNGNPPRFFLSASLVWAAVVVSLAVSLAGCGGGGGGGGGSATPATVTPPVASLSIAAPPATLPVGGTMQLAAVPRDSAGNVLSGRIVGWTSDNSAVVTVDGNGVVTAVSAGTAVITAISEGVRDSITFTVTATSSPAPVATVAINQGATASLTVGGTLQLSASVRDAANNVLAGRAIIWNSSNTGVASVSSNGLVSALAVGSATITASADGVISSPMTVTVSAASASALPSYVTSYTAWIFSRGYDPAVAVYGTEGQPTVNVHVETAEFPGATGYRYLLRSSGVADQTVDSARPSADFMLPVAKRFTVDITALAGRNGFATSRQVALWTNPGFPVLWTFRFLATQSAANRRTAPVFSGVVGNVGWTPTSGVQGYVTSADGNTFALATGMTPTTASGQETNGYFGTGNEYFDRFLPGAGNIFGNIGEVLLNGVTPFLRVIPNTNGARNPTWVLTAAGVGAPTQ